MARLPWPTRIMMSVDKVAVRWTGQSLFMRLYAMNQGLTKDPNFRPVPSLLLVTTGRRSGQPRSVVLPFFDIDGKRFVVGSRGGAPIDPDWVHNLRHTPAATVYIHRRAHRVAGRIATSDERAVLWPKLVAAAPTYAAYQKGTSREIPLVIIEQEESHAA